MTAATTARAGALAFALAYAVAAASSCSIDHRSDDFECDSTHPCTGGRVCQEGLCVIVGGGTPDARVSDAPILPPDGRVCPETCDECVFPTMTCIIDGAAGEQVVCPEDWHCNVTCDAQQACARVDCEKSLSCTVLCSAFGTCDDVRCPVDGDCDVTCSGSQSCAAVDCDQSCACDVRCQHVSSCSNSIDCPLGCQFGSGCTSVAIPGCDNCM
jgi:hypothetical protein